jgi:outer membrane protein TolC
MSSIAIAQQLDPVLKELISKGLDKSQSVNINNFDKEQANIDQKLARSVFLPKVTINSSYTRLDDDITFGNDTENLLLATQNYLLRKQ